jgi:proteasome lid subunit RPN8/RPN11
MMSLPDTLLAEIRAHAARDYPRESCGLVIVRKGRRRYAPVRNIAEKNEHFVMHPEDQAAAEDAGEVVLVVHSHPNVAARPSQADLVGCERSGVPWLIVNWPTGAVHTFAPTGYQAPLYGREFSHGVLDCYTFVKDYFAQTLSIELPDFNRPDEWWLKGQDLYLQGFEAAGFVRVDGRPEKHDGLLMRVGSPVPNHGAIFLGDGCIGHHQSNRLSSRDVYGGWFQKVTTHVLRHRSFIK